MNKFFVAFPPDSVICAPGDYLICRQPSGVCNVCRVEDLLLVKRLLPMPDDPSTLALEEHLLDSMAPAYFNEVQVLVTDFDPDFAQESDAIRAIHNRTLIERARRVLRSAREFRPSNCQVVQPEN